MATAAPETTGAPTPVPASPVPASVPTARTAPVEEPTIGKLVADATGQLSSIVRNEIALAKTEVSVDVKKAGKGGAFLAVAGVCAVLALIFLLHSIAWGFMALGLNGCAAYAIVFGLLLILAAVFGLMGKQALSKIKGKPERTIATTKDTIETVKHAAS